MHLSVLFIFKSLLTWNKKPMFQYNIAFPNVQHKHSSRKETKTGILISYFLFLSNPNPNSLKQWFVSRRTPERRNYGTHVTLGLCCLGKPWYLSLL